MRNRRRSGFGSGTVRDPATSQAPKGRSAVPVSASPAPAKSATRSSGRSSRPAVEGGAEAKALAAQDIVAQLVDSDIDRAVQGLEPRLPVHPGWRWRAVQRRVEAVGDQGKIQSRARRADKGQRALDLAGVQSRPQPAQTEPIRADRGIGGEIQAGEAARRQIRLNDAEPGEKWPQLARLQRQLAREDVLGRHGQGGPAQDGLPRQDCIKPVQLGTAARGQARLDPEPPHRRATPSQGGELQASAPAEIGSAPGRGEQTLPGVDQGGRRRQADTIERQVERRPFRQIERSGTVQLPFGQAHHQIDELHPLWGGGQARFRPAAQGHIRRQPSRKLTLLGAELQLATQIRAARPRRQLAAKLQDGRRRARPRPRLGASS